MEFQNFFDKLIRPLREKYMGDFIELPFNNNPPFLFPKFSIYKEWFYKRITHTQINYINELIFTIKSEQDIYFLISNIDTLLGFISQCAIGTKFNYKIIISNNKIINLSSLYEVLRKVGSICNILISIENPNINIPYEYLRISEKVNFEINITDSSIYENNLKDVLKIIKENEYVYIKVVSESTYKNALSIMEENIKNNIRIRPFYNGKNFKFLYDFVFLNNIDILNSKITKKDFIVRSLINPMFFGKIYLKNNGKICCNNSSEEHIGTLHDSPLNLSSKCLKNSLWKKTRLNSNPCCKCIYRLLCPPISELELSMNKYDLCILENC